MKLCTRHLTTSLTLIVILLAGCSGCAQKTTPDTPFETLQADNRQSTSEHLRYDKENGLGINMHTGDGLILFEEYRGFVIQGESKPIKPPQIRKEK